MILQSLVDYYEAMARKDKISRLGWSKVRIQYALEIDEFGNLAGVLPLESVNEKGKAEPKFMEMPASVKRSSGVKPNFLWDNMAYLLGIESKSQLVNEKASDIQKRHERTLECFNEAKKLHISLLENENNTFAKAICAFFRKWNPEEESNNPVLKEYIDSLTKSANLTFIYQGTFPQTEKRIEQIWDNNYCNENNSCEEKMRCIVTGELTVPEATHPSIMRVKGAQPAGAALVSFNAPAYCSYGREQNINAPIGNYAAFAYTTALNYLISDIAHRKIIGETTVLYWAENAEVQYQDSFGCFLDGETVTDNDLKGVMDAVSQGKKTDLSGLLLNPDNHFYILGIAPNAARLSVRFFIKDTFGSIIKHLDEHYKRLEIIRPDYDSEVNIPLWKLLGETVNQNAKNKDASPQMSGDTLRAILEGTRYPTTLLQQTELRIRADRNVTRRRAALIKAYLLKNADSHMNKEALTVELNEETIYQPYVLGRMFSVLEAIQQKANPGINTTIKDKYFTSACSTPAVIFPTLISLAEKHLRKLDNGSQIWYSKQLGSLTMMLNESYPMHLSLNDQGIFQLGYYHQTQKRYEKKISTTINHEGEK